MILLICVVFKYIYTDELISKIEAHRYGKHVYQWVKGSWGRDKCVCNCAFGLSCKANSNH